MECLADTVGIVRYFSQTGRLGNSAKSIFEGAEVGENVIYISIVSIMEIMYLSEKNKIPLKLMNLIRRLEVADNYKVVDLDLDTIFVANKIKGLELHDRLIVATAKYLGVPIITSDEMISKSSVIEIIWE